MAEGIKPPVPIYHPEPSYTAQAWRQHVQGRMALGIVIRKDGSVTDVQLKSKPLPASLEKSVVETIGTWRFRPATRDGKPVAVKVLVEVTLRLPAGGKHASTPPQGSALHPEPLEGVIPPKPIYAPDPEYTPEACRARFEGQATVEVSVDEQGRVTHAQEVGPRLGKGLDAEAIKAAREWKFDPATRDGKPTKDTVRIIVLFRL